MKLRADELLAQKGFVQSRSHGAQLIKLKKVLINNKLVDKPGRFVDESSEVQVSSDDDYVSRAGYKLASVAKILQINFKDKTVLDVGSSTGGFTDFALRGGAKKVIAVDVGTKQLHPSLLGYPKIELHEQTDIRNFNTKQKIDVIVMDVSFISAREVLPFLAKFMTKNSQLVVMIKPQFEAQSTGVKHKGVIKNNAMRRQVLKAFEQWAKNVFIIVDKADSKVAGSKGNIERFYVLKKLK